MEDLRKLENSMIFSEGSKRNIHEQGNIGLYELGHMSKPIRCHIRAWKHLPEGPQFCICGIYLRPDEDTIRKIGARFKNLDCAALLCPYYPFQRQQVRWIPMSKRSMARTPQEQRSKMTRILSQSGGNRMSSTKNRKWPTDGLRSTANIGSPQDDWHWVLSHVEAKTQMRKCHCTGHDYKRSSRRGHE